MSVEAKIIADSISPAGARITSFELTIHRFILLELSRHRAFSLSVSSSRAIPLERAIDQVENDPAEPLFWGKARAGMQATEELDHDERGQAREAWLNARTLAVIVARNYFRPLKVHKQTAARILEPYSWSRVLCTSTDYANFFSLRMHRDAQPEVQAVAVAMARAMRDSEPAMRDLGDWHLPYVGRDERDAPTFVVARKISAARCARVSYRAHDGRVPDPAEDLSLFDRLMGGDPKHSSPSEHQAFALRNPRERSGNLVGWGQHRQLIAGNVAPPDFDWRARLAEYGDRDFVV